MTTTTKCFFGLCLTTLVCCTADNQYLDTSKPDFALPDLAPAPDFLVPCMFNWDCPSGVCTVGACQAATCEDDHINGMETDVDCGGPHCKPCTTRQHCANVSDCMIGLTCLTVQWYGSYQNSATFCVPIGACMDGVLNGTETDVDCGGPDCWYCPPDPAYQCRKPTDCLSGVCTNLRCQPPPYMDGFKDGFETDVDCGGSDAPSCEARQRCRIHQDCIPSTKCIGDVCQRPK
jgi:hypothetical protein